MIWCSFGVSWSQFSVFKNKVTSSVKFHFQFLCPKSEVKTEPVNNRYNETSSMKGRDLESKK